jgi:two-component system, OmpR family, response regulator
MGEESHDPMRVLLVEDDRKAARVLRRGLQEEGFTVDVSHAGDEGQYQAEINEYDVIVLDWMLPGKPGIDVCRDLRSRGIATPILFLTAKDAVADRVAGLNTGADDYLTKPFAFVELLARIRALLRRGEAAHTPLLKVGDLVLDPVSHRVTRGDRRVVLTPKEYALLEYLLRHRDRVVTRTELGEHIWQEEHDTLTNLVDVHLSHLRRKLEGGAAAPLIHTVRGRGYRLGAE